MPILKTPEELEERRLKRQAYSREWARNNRDKRNAYRAKWIEKNLAKYAETTKRYQDSHRDLYNGSARKSYARNNEKRRAWQAAYRRNNRAMIADSQRRHVFGKDGNEYYHQQFRKQHGLCAICKKTGENTSRSLGLDHDHKFDPKDPRGWRGLLCMYCNAGIGNFMEDISLLGGAARDYLLRWSSPRELEKAS